MSRTGVLSASLPGLPVVPAEGLGRGRPLALAVEWTPDGAHGVAHTPPFQPPAHLSSLAEAGRLNASFPSVPEARDV